MRPFVVLRVILNTVHERFTKEKCYDNIKKDMEAERTVSARTPGASVLSIIPL